MLPTQPELSHQVTAKTDYLLGPLSRSLSSLCVKVEVWL
jgi:hypothetical protein